MATFLASDFLVYHDVRSGCEREESIGVKCDQRVAIHVSGGRSRGVGTRMDYWAIYLSVECLAGVGTNLCVEETV